MTGASPPTAAELTTRLGSAAGLWSAIVRAVGQHASPLEAEWRPSKSAFGRMCLLRHEKRTLLYLTPDTDRVTVAIVLGDRAYDQAKASGLPPSIEMALSKATRYAEGRGLRLSVTSPSEIPAIVDLVKAKTAAAQRADRDTTMKKSTANSQEAASDLISQRIADLGDWRGDTLGRMRTLITQADPDVVEEWKWMGTPTWSHGGIICTGETYKKVVKLTFAKGASLADPAGLFNSSLDGNVRRAIDIHEGETVNAAAFKALVRDAVALNTAGKAKAATKATPAAKATAATKATSAKKAKSPAKAKALNATWHQAHRMPERPTPAQQLRWHEAHAKHCGCRPFTPAMRAKLRRAVAAAGAVKTRR